MEEELRQVHEKSSIVAHTNAGRFSSIIHRMKAKNDLGIPTHRRIGFAVSAESNPAANEMADLAWELFFTGLCDDEGVDEPLS